MSFTSKGTIIACVAAAMMLSVLPPGFAASDRGEYLVRGAGGSALRDAGYEVIDDYGAAATARLTREEADVLAGRGFAVTALDHTSGRGAQRIDPRAADAAVPDALKAAPDTPYYLIQFRGPVKAEWREALRANAGTVFDYLPHDTFLVGLDADGRARLAALPEVRAVVPYHPAFKLSPDLPAQGLVQATVLADKTTPLGEVVEALSRAGAIATDFTTAPREHVIDVTVSAPALADLARLEPVLWIEPALDDASADNELSSAITQSGGVGAWPVHDEGVDGGTQKVSICDTGANTDIVFPPAGGLGIIGISGVASPVQLVQMVHELHDDADGLGLVQYNRHLQPPTLQLPLDHRKIDLYYSPQENGNKGDADDGDGHGTHTSGTLAGDHPAYGARNGNDGVAFGARLLVCDITIGAAFQVLNDYSNYWNPAYDAGARINSNSWGSAHTNAYTEKARQHDDYVWNHRDFLILRSMGNTGPAGMIRPEAVAKNAMGIGATVNGAGAENLAGFSTGGLTQDGRMKPNVVAPGDCLTSSSLGGAAGYVCLSGTSMSTPTTSGAAALVRDYFEKGYHPTGAANAADEFSPSSALVRAVLEVSGKEITGDRGETKFPNKAQGWGRVLLEDALFFAGDARKLVALDEDVELATGQTLTTTVEVTAGQPLRLLVAWVDQAAAAGANPALVNNLDLVVVGPAGTYRGNAFVGNEVPPNQGVPDDRNVEEAVYVNAPASGTYTVEVVGTNVPSGPQAFALVATGNVAP